jgi:nucleoside-diphosphate-sugar epimerase
MKILILGGSQYFGRKLVNLLIQKGHEVTIFNRGNRNEGLDKRAKLIIGDRNIKSDLEKTLSVHPWDIIYDQICFDFDQAKLACEVFQGQVNHYVHTSTVSVYEYGESISESVFDPKTHTFETKESVDTNYGEAKRQAEVAFELHAQFSRSYVRLPIVVGHDDVTKRFQFHASRIKEGKEIFFHNFDAKMSFINSDDAAWALKYIGENKVQGPINTCSAAAYSLRDFMGIIENFYDKKIKLAKNKTDENSSPYGIEKDWFISADKLNNAGLELESIDKWLPKHLELLKTK